jgi:TP901 family phage tail tape measure protein
MGSKSLASINFRLLANIKDFSTKMQNAHRVAAEFAKKTGKMGRNLSRNVTAPILGVGLATVKLASDFESSFSKIENLVGITGDELETFKEQVKELSGSTAKSPKELADALFFVTSAGLRGAEAMEALTASAKASAIGMGETEMVADAVTSVMNAYGSEVMNAARATDILTGLVRAGKVEATEIAPVIGQVVGLASQMGISFEEVAASMATFTKLGVPASETATGLKSLMNGMLKPTEKSRDALASIGLTFGDLRKRIREDGLADSLLFLTRAFDGNLEGLSALVPNVRAFNTILSTAGAQGETYKQVLDDITNSTGLVDDGFKKVSATTQFKFNQALSDLKAIGTDLGTTLLPIVTRMLDKIKEWTTAFKALDDESKKNIIRIAGIAAVIGPLLIVISQLTLALKTLTLVNPWVFLGIAIAGVALKLSSDFKSATGVASKGAIDLAGTTKTAKEELSLLNDELERSSKNKFQVMREDVSKKRAAVVEEIEKLTHLARDEANELFLLVMDYNKTLKLIDKKEAEYNESISSSITPTASSITTPLLTPSYADQWGIDFNDVIDQVEKRVLTFGENMTNVGINMAEQFATGFAALFDKTTEMVEVGDEMVERVVSFKDKFSDFLKTFLAGIAKMIIQTAILAGLMAIIFPGSAAGGASFMGNFKKILGGGSPLKGFAAGGQPPVGQISLVGEAGPELFVPNTSGTIIPNHMLGGGGTQTIIPEVRISGSDLVLVFNKTLQEQGGVNI